jgi:hypothetical protein
LRMCHAVPTRDSKTPRHHSTRMATLAPSQAPGQRSPPRSSHRRERKTGARCRHGAPARGRAR